MSRRLDPWPYPKLFAHRGGGTLAPENTLAGMRMAEKCGYRAVEFDVKLSRDNRAILLHDDTLERTTNGQGLARDFAYGELALLDAGLWHSPRFQFEPIPRFDGIAWHLIRAGMLANVEIKPCEGRDAQTGEIVGRLCAEYWAQAVPCLVSSFSYAALKAARAVAPGLPFGWLVRSPGPSDWEILAELGCVSFHFWEHVATREVIDEAHRRGYRVLLWTVNEVARAQELFAMGADGLFTDNLEVFAQYFPALRAPASP
jgi:glycerophosphoryl diester phosphodiesterase